MKKFKVGLQLYSVRDEMEKDMDKTLGAVKAMGYDYVEFAGYFEKSAEEVKALLDKHGLECISVHQAPSLFFEEGQKAVDFLKVIGAKYCAIPWYEASKLAGTPDWEDTVKRFTELGKLLKGNDIQLLYHNHDFEFEKFEDKYLLDHLYDTIDADLIDPELDTCWVKYGGEDPVKYIKKYAGRVTVLHLKDFTAKAMAQGPAYALIDADGKETKKATKEDNGFKFMPCGSGIQDFEAILAAAEESGTEYVIVEQDSSYETPSLEAAKQSRDYLKTLGL